MQAREWARHRILALDAISSKPQSAAHRVDAMAVQESAHGNVGHVWADAMPAVRKCIAQQLHCRGAW